MRGRGIARGMMNNANRSDNFRSRPPNTSRPPSMHVDDFMKLEKGQNDQQESQIPTTSTMIRRGDKVRKINYLFGQLIITDIPNRVLTYRYTVSGLKCYGQSVM